MTAVNFKLIGSAILAAFGAGIAVGYWVRQSRSHKLEQLILEALDLDHGEYVGESYFSRKARRAAEV